MINENTLRILNDIGFGADVDSLESYIIDFKQARLVSNIKFYEPNYLKLCKILKELKPNSLALSDKFNLQPVELEKNDRLFGKYPNIDTEITYGTNNSSINNIKINLDNEKEHSSDIFALTNVSGVNVKCVYILGYLYRIEIIGENNKYNDVTDILKNNLPYEIRELSEYDIVELRGKITIFKDKKKVSLNIPCSVMRSIRTNTYTENLKLIFDDIIIEDDSILPYGNQWEKLDFMREIGISVPHHALIRNIDRDTFEQALHELDNYFIKETEDTNAVYEYSGIKIKFNTDIYCNTVGHSIIYNGEDCDPNQEFMAVVKSMSTINSGNVLKQRLNITDTKCNNRTVIKFIDLEDTYDLEKYNVSIGKRVKFKMIENKAVLIK